MTTAAQKMAQIAANAPKQLPTEMSDLYNEIVKGVAEAAKKGLRGTAMTIELPDHQCDYCAHIVGDLRAGGFQLDIIGYEPTMQGATITFFLTW